MKKLITTHAKQTTVRVFQGATRATRELIVSVNLTEGLDDYNAVLQAMPFYDATVTDWRMRKYTELTFEVLQTSQVPMLSVKIADDGHTLCTVLVPFYLNSFQAVSRATLQFEALGFIVGDYEYLTYDIKKVMA